ncbi:hypothetical protein ABZ875_10545, partial [Streptomyces albidoflavus]
GGEHVGEGEPAAVADQFGDEEEHDEPGDEEAGRALPAARDPRLAPALDTGAAPPGAPQTPAGPTGGPATGVHALRPAQREAPADWGPHRPYEDPHQPPPPPRSRNPRP